MKNRMKTAALLLAFCLLLPLGACNPGSTAETPPPDGGVSGNGDNMVMENDFVDDGIFRRFEWGDFDVVEDVDLEEDTGELISYTFEAENIRFDGVSKNSAQSFSHACIAKSLQFSPGFSGNLCVKNFSTVPLTLTITSDKDVNVPVEILVSNRIGSEDDDLLAGQSVNSYLTVSNTLEDGKRRNVLDSDVVFPDGGVKPEGCNDFFNMVSVSFRLNLHEGKNILVFRGANEPVNFDAFIIHTSAQVSENETPSSWFDDIENQVQVPVSPSENRTGTITFDCTDEKDNQGSASFSTLPPLTSDVYEHVTEEGEERYYLTLCGQKVNVVKPAAPETYPAGESLGDTVTRKDGSYSFWTVAADGNEDRTATEGWYPYANTSDYEGGTGVPVLQNGGTAEQYLEFTKASRFELFWVKDEKGNIYHLGDASRNWKPAPSGLYGQEYMYEMQMSADGAYNIELLGLSESRPTAGTSYKNGITFRFNGDTIEMLKYNSAEVQATAELKGVDFGDGKTRKFSFCVTRADSNTVSVRLFVDGVKATFAETEKYADGYVENGTLYVTNGYLFGQRFSVIPAASTGVDPTTVKIYDLDIIKVTK